VRHAVARIERVIIDHLPDRVVEATEWQRQAPATHALPNEQTKPIEHSDINSLATDTRSFTQPGLLGPYPPGGCRGGRVGVVIGAPAGGFDTNDTNRSQGDIGTIRTRARLASLEGPSVSLPGKVPGCGKHRAGIIVVSPSTVSIFRPIELAADFVFPAAVVEIGRRLSTAIFDSYRPELHYMRGPGPKWREKHAYAGSIDLPSSVNGTSAHDCSYKGTRRPH
jgi:hypothetical protein